MRLRKINYFSKNSLMKAYSECQKLEIRKPHYGKTVFLRRAYLSLIPRRMSYLHYQITKWPNSDAKSFDSRVGLQKIISRVKKKKNYQATCRQLK